MRGCDAVRFGVARDGEKLVWLKFVLEAAHLPVAHGLIEYDRARETWASVHPEPRLQKMAECFLESYVRARGNGGRSPGVNG
jgi:hypothetical protein